MSISMMSMAFKFSDLGNTDMHGSIDPINLNDIEEEEEEKKKLNKNCSSSL